MISEVYMRSASGNSRARKSRMVQRFFRLLACG